MFLRAATFPKPSDHAHIHVFPQSIQCGRDTVDPGDVLQARLTFDEAMALDSLTIMTRQRLKIIRGQLFALLDTAAVL